MTYEWEPTPDTYYPMAVLAERTFGYFYNVLAVEQTNEGWHGILLDFGGDTFSPELEMVDEQVFDSKYAAVLWAESVDQGKYQESEVDDAEFWLTFRESEREFE